jgi:hypothetical protein
MVENDHRLAKLVEHLDPCPPNKVFWIAGHASITAKLSRLFALETVLGRPEIAPHRSISNPSSGSGSGSEK